MSQESKKKVVERCLGIYALLLVSLTALAWGVYFAEGQPEMSRPLFESSDRFRDLTNYAGKIARLADGGAALGNGLPTYNYPAPAAYVYAFFLRGFPHHPVRAYLLILLVGLVAGGVTLWTAARNRGMRTWGPVCAIVATGVLGFPMLFTADRGNLEGAVALALGVGLALFIAGRYNGAAVFIGLAASIKPFPGLFLLLLVRKRLYRQAALGVVTAALSTLLALTALGPTPIAAYKGLQPGVKRYYNNYIMNVPQLYEGRFNHSIMDSLKSIAKAYLDHSKKGSPSRVTNPDDAEAASAGPSASPQLAGKAVEAEPLQRSTHYAQIHILFLIAMFAGALAFVFVLLRVFQLPAVNQMILVAVAITLLPPVAAEYTLLHLYVPFGAFVIFLVRDVASERVVFERNRIMTVLTLFALLFSPLSFFGRYSGDVMTLALAALLIVAGSYPMPSSIFNEIESGAAIRA